MRFLLLCFILSVQDSQEGGLLLFYFFPRFGGNKTGSVDVPFLYPLVS